MVDENEGMCQYELDRLARIAENKKRMQVCMPLLGSCMYIGVIEHFRIQSICVVQSLYYS